jgi:nicotinamidase-related amidase
MEAELAAKPADRVIEKSTCNAFISGELDRLIRSQGIRHLAIWGDTIDVCVHSTLRAAVDLGYECLLLADCCGRSMADCIAVQSNRSRPKTVCSER